VAAVTTQAQLRVDRRRLTSYAGYYEASENNMMGIMANPDGFGMHVLVDGLPDESLIATDSASFASSERPFRMRFDLDARGVANGMTVWSGGNERRAPRVAPLPSTLHPVADTDPALAKRILVALDALRRGGDALAGAADVTPGAKADFGHGANPALDAAPTAVYLGEEDLTGRQIHRHGSDVARVRMYRMQTPGGPRYLLVHLTSAGMVTDYDIVLQ
jgi:hypothetical protein